MSTIRPACTSRKIRSRPTKAYCISGGNSGKARSKHVGIIQRAAAGCQYVTLVHRGKRPEEPKGAVGQQQASDDAQGTISPRRLQDAPSEPITMTVGRPQPRPEWPRRSANGSQLAGNL